MGQGTDFIVEDVPLVWDGIDYVRVRTQEPPATFDFPLTSDGSVGDGPPVVRPVEAMAQVSLAKRAAIAYRSKRHLTGTPD